jgi:hypothetical protein
LKGIFTHGYDRWDKILKDENLWKEENLDEKWEIIYKKLESVPYSQLDK